MDLPEFKFSPSDSILIDGIVFSIQCLVSGGWVEHRQYKNYSSVIACKRKMMDSFYDGIVSDIVDERNRPNQTSYLKVSDKFIYSRGDLESRGKLYPDYPS